MEGDRIAVSSLADLFRQKLKAVSDQLEFLRSPAVVEAGTNGMGYTFAKIRDSQLFVGCWVERHWKRALQTSDQPHLWAGVSSEHDKTIDRIETYPTIVPSRILSERGWKKLGPYWAMEDSVELPTPSELVLERYEDPENFLGYYEFGSDAESLTEKAAELVADLAREVAEAKLIKLMLKEEPNQPFRHQMIRARVGQGLYRAKLCLVESECRITGVTDLRFLVASHMKPWVKCETGEHMDGNNGLLLTPTIDRLFDKGYLTFENDGTPRWSDRLPLDQLQKLNVARTANRQKAFSKEQVKFLEYHRQRVFR